MYWYRYALVLVIEMHCCSQTSMNAYQMEEEVHVTRYVPTPLDHSPAAVSLETMCLDMTAALVR